MLIKDKTDYDAYVQTQSSRSNIHSNANTFFNDFKSANIKISLDAVIMDVGCRLRADTVVALTELGYNAYGCDIGSSCRYYWDSELPALASKLSQCDIHDGNPFPDIKFDVVTMSHVVEHCFDPFVVREHVSDMVVPGGYLHSIVPIEEKHAFVRHTPHCIMFKDHEEHLAFWTCVGFDLMYANLDAKNYSIAILKKNLQKSV